MVRSTATTTTTRGGGSNSSKESLSEKLSAGNRRGDQKRGATRNKRLSLTSETSHSTAGSSSGASLQHVAMATPISPQQPHFGRSSTVNTTSSRREEDKITNRSKSNRRRRSSAGGSRRRSNSNDNSLRERVADESSRRRGRQAAGREDVNAPSHTASTESRSRRESVNRSSVANPLPTSRDTTKMSASSRRRQRSRGRSSEGRAATVTAAAASESQPATPSTRKRVSKSISSSKKKGEKASSSNKPKRSSSSGKQQSLTSFMQKEYSNRDPETEEALEVKSAFTSVSRSRNRSTAKAKKAEAQLQSSLQPKDLMSASYHGDSAGALRNTRSFRDLMKTKLAEEEERQQKANYVFDTRNTGKTLHTFAAKSNTGGTFRSQSNNKNWTRWDGEGDETESSMDVSWASFSEQQVHYNLPASLRRSHTEEVNKKQQPDNNESIGVGEGSLLRRTLSDAAGATFHQSFTSLPVLLEEQKKKPKKTKSSGNKSRSKAATTTKSNNKGTRVGISTQELSDFLERCNAKRRRQQQQEVEAQGKQLSSPDGGGDRSCVSMPTIGGKPQLVRKASSSRFTSPQLQQRSLASNITKRQQSQRSLQTSSSDPYPSATVVKGSSNNKHGPLIEKLSQKGEHRARSRSKRRRAKNDDNRPREESHNDISSSKDEARRRSKSANKQLKAKKQEAGDESRTRSLSRSRRSSSKAAKPVPSLLDDGSAQPPTLSSSNRESTGKQRSGRSRGFQKLFSIRDLKDGGEGVPALTRMEFRRDDTSSAWAPKTPSTSQRGRQQQTTDDGFVMMTPPPPLAPHSPLRSGRGPRSFDDGETEAAGHGATLLPPYSASLEVEDSAEEDGEAAGQYANRRHRSSRAERFDAQRPDSILKHSAADQIVQTSGDDTEERQSEVLKQDLFIEYETVLGVEKELGIAEDVFTHYEWSEGSSSNDDTELMRQERKRLKDSIRTSLLHDAFEAIDAIQ